jgi:hypothetical protein
MLFSAVLDGKTLKREVSLARILVLVLLVCSLGLVDLPVQAAQAASNDSQYFPMIFY